MRVSLLVVLSSVYFAATATDSSAGSGGRASSNHSMQSVQQSQNSGRQIQFKAKWNRTASSVEKNNPGVAKKRTSTSVSNIMKTKHDTVKNSISNVR